ncbi:hypothetical protein RMATCC62417_03049 [Rhizopus microsporus]|nr:hypothetical protein RMATCC62417_03049 [Rhizopus microsporus]
MSKSLVLEQYTPFFREITIDIDSWKNIIENSPAYHAVCWIYKNKTNGDLSTLNEEDQPMPNRVARRSIIWKIKYICHRSEFYKSRVGVQTEDESSKSQPIQKPSKKIDSRCYVTVTCYFLAPNQVTNKMHNEHNHFIGSLDDISFLPLSDNTKEAILQKLREGYDRRGIRAAIQCHFNERIRDLFPKVTCPSTHSAI